MQEGHTVEVVSPKFLGIPLRVVVSKPPALPLTTSDYVELYDETLVTSGSSGTRIQWEWLKAPSAELTFRPPPIAGRPVTVARCRVVFLTKGGWILAGTKAAETFVTLENPLRAMHPDAGGDRFISVFVDLATTVPHGSVTMLFDQVRVDSTPAECAGSFMVARPRVQGLVLLQYQSLAGVLGSATVFIPPNADNTSELSIAAVEGEGATGLGIAQGACAVAPDQVFETQAAGCVQRGDMVFVLPVERSLALPPMLQFQQPLARFDINGDTGRTSVRIKEEGLFVVSLALKQPSGAFIRGGYCFVLVSSRHQRGPPSSGGSSSYSASPMPPPLFSFAPPLARPPVADPPAAGASSSGDERVSCVICRDATICIKLAPCNHVCLCEACCEMLRRGGGAEGGGGADPLCPCCRSPVRSIEKVFLP